MSGLYIKYPPRGSGSSGGGGLTGSVSLTNQVSGILPIANGGTNSGTALNNLRFVISSGGAIVESAALTANSPLRTNAAGLPSVGSTSLTSEVSGNLPLSQTSGSISLTNQVSGNLPLSQTSGSLSLQTQVIGSLSLSSLAGAVAVNTIDSLNNTQTWNWSTLSNQNAISIASPTLTSGSLLSLTNSFNDITATGNILSIIATGGQSIRAVGIGITHTGNNNVCKGMQIDMNGVSQPTTGLVVNNVSGANGGTPFGIKVNMTSNTVNGNTIGIFSTVAGQLAGTYAGQFTVTDPGAAGSAIYASTLGNVGYAADLVSTGVGSRDALRIQNITTSSNTSAAQMIFSLNRGVTSSLTSIAGVAGMITDVTVNAYKGALIFSTANNAAPAERMRIDNTGISTFTTKVVSPIVTIGSISHTSSAGGAAYTVTWPGAQGSSGQTISNDGSGNLAWAATTGLTNPMTTSGDIIIGSGGGAAIRLAIGSGSFTLVSNPALSPAMQYENITSPDDLRNVKLKAIGDGSGGITVTLLSSQADGDPGTPPSTTNPLRIAVRNPNINSTNTRYHLVTITASMSCSIAQSSNGGVLASSGGYYWVYLIANPALPFPGNAYSLGWSAAKLDEGKLQNSFVDAQGINIGNGSTSWATPITTNIQAGMRFSLTSGGVVQSGFSVGVSYYVVNPTATSFDLSATSGGSSITAGSGGSQMAMHWQSPHLVTNSASFSLQPVRLLGRITPSYPTIIGSMTAPFDVVCGGTILPVSPAVTSQVFTINTAGVVGSVSNLSGTYYLPPTCQAIKVTIVGGGGGGGGTASAVASGGAGSGGGGGGTAIKYILNPGSSVGAASSTSYTFSVGGGGTGGAAGNNAGAVGSSSTFGTSFMSGFGGMPGSGGGATAIAITGNGGAGGNAIGGDINAPGSGGLYGLVIAASSSAGGNGGGTLFAGSTADNLNSNAAGVNGSLYGGGGAGADNINNGGAFAGGNGANGIVIVEEYY